MHRRQALHLLATLPMTVTKFPATPVTPKQPLGLVIHSYGIRGTRPMDPDFSAISDALAFADHAARIGAAGIQTRIGPSDPDAGPRLRAAIERHDLYIEGIVSLPRDEADLGRFEDEVRATQMAGASVLRTVCLSGRRYETFDSIEQFKAFADRSWKSLTLAEPIVRKFQMRLAVENHKDWRIDEMLGWLKRLDSEHVGVCLDTGNSIALLEDPYQVVEAFAPWTITTHFKDMGVAECDDGFLLAEVPLGDGFLDLRRIIRLLRKTRPGVRFNLEMITRDPLKVPCLTPKYWATLGEVRAWELAESLTRVRKHSFNGPLPSISGLSHREQLLAEAANIDRCLGYAKSHWSE